MSKSLSMEETRYSNIDGKRSVKHTTWFREVPSLLLCQGGKYNNRPQTPGTSLQKRCSYIVTETRAYTTQNSPIKIKNNLQTWMRSVRSRLPIKPKLQRKQRWWNTSTKININAIEMATDIPNCMTTQEILQAKIKDNHLQQLREYILRDWPDSRMR